MKTIYKSENQTVISFANNAVLIVVQKIDDKWIEAAIQDENEKQEILDLIQSGSERQKDLKKTLLQKAERGVESGQFEKIEKTIFPNKSH